MVSRIALDDDGFALGETAVLHGFYDLGEASGFDVVEESLFGEPGEDLVLEGRFFFEGGEVALVFVSLVDSAVGF